MSISFPCIQRLGGFHHLGEDCGALAFQGHPVDAVIGNEIVTDFYNCSSHLNDKPGNELGYYFVRSAATCKLTDSAPIEACRIGTLLTIIKSSARSGATSVRYVYQ